MIDVPVLVKDALRDGFNYKVWEFDVLNDDGSLDFKIDNPYLLTESVKYDERMCSDRYLKFGLCEGTSLEFQYFDKPSILGRRINAKLFARYTDSDGDPDWYEIPMGFFTVEQVSRQASTGIMKATAYNKLQSNYLDADASSTILNLVESGEYGETNKLSLYSLLKDLLNNYGIEEYNYSTIQTIPGVRSYNVSTIDLCNSSGTSLSQKLYLCMMTVSATLDPDEFYNFMLHTGNLLAFARDNIWNAYKGYYTNPGHVMTIEDFASETYHASYDLSGELLLRKDAVSFLLTRKGGEINIRTGDYTNAIEIEASIPVHAQVGTSPPTINTTLWDNYFSSTWGNDYDFYDIYKKNLSTAEKIRITTAEAEGFKDVTLRDLQSAAYETVCQYGKLDRSTDLFSGVELNYSQNNPADTLYPGTGLYPYGSSFSASKSTYSKLWADEGNVQKFRYLIITYKGLDENNQEKDFTLQRTVNADGTMDYNCSDNWLFRNLVWDAADIGDYADAMVLKMKDISWFPFEMWSVGLPYLETGDQIEIPMGENTYNSYILQRTLTGIQNLQDTYINGELDIF